VNQHPPRSNCVAESTTFFAIWTRLGPSHRTGVRALRFVIDGRFRKLWRQAEGECAARAASPKIPEARDSALSAGLHLSIAVLVAGPTISHERSIKSVVRWISREGMRRRHWKVLGTEGFHSLLPRPDSYSAVQSRSKEELKRGCSKFDGGWQPGEPPARNFWSHTIWGVLATRCNEAESPENATELIAEAIAGAHKSNEQMCGPELFRLHGETQLLVGELAGPRPKNVFATP
jgi:hypothetical protein